MNSLINEVLRSNTSFDKTIESSDITVCLIIRVSDMNLWALDRLQFILNYYDPSPQFLIVDLGSSNEYSQQIEAICRRSESIVKYEYVHYFSEFSASIGRNACLKLVDTELIFFTDVDIVHPKSFFHLLVDLSNDLDINRAIRRCLFMPVYHINKEYTEIFNKLDDECKSGFLRELCYLGQSERFGSKFEFIAPYSNVFLIHRDFFDLSGGYSTDFIGYGSEDFEFLIRLGMLSTDIPIPNSFEEDLYGPTKDSFWGVREYSGFRRYLEVLTTSSESLGLNAFHLWHEKPSCSGYWTQSGDKDRSIFKKVLKQYYPQVNKLINIDHHERIDDILCISRYSSAWEYFLPLRLLSCKIQHFIESSLEFEAEDNLLLEIKKGIYKKIFIFEHDLLVNINTILKEANINNIEIYFINKGIFKGSISFVSLKSPLIFSSDYVVSNKNLAERVLEEVNKYTTTSNFLGEIQKFSQEFFFIDLSSIEKHSESIDIFNEILSSLKKSFNYNFVIKIANEFQSYIKVGNLTNVKFLPDTEDIRLIIKAASVVIIFDSLNTEFFAYIYEKKYCVFNPHLNIEGTKVITSLSEGIELYDKGVLCDTFLDIDTALRIIEWLIGHCYSWYSYNQGKVGMLQILNINGAKYYCGSCTQDYFFSNKSYLSLKNNIPREEFLTKYNIFKQFGYCVISLFLNKNKRKKFREYPAKFFKDSDNFIIKFIMKFF